MDTSWQAVLTTMRRRFGESDIPGCPRHTNASVPPDSLGPQRGYRIYAAGSPSWDTARYQNCTRQYERRQDDDLAIEWGDFEEESLNYVTC